MDCTAKIAAKGLQSTGITEVLARKYHDNLGMKQMAIIEFVAQTRTEDTDGHQTVQLNILTVEPAVDENAANHLRDLTRAMFMNRKLHNPDDQPTLDSADDIEPTVADVLRHGAGLTLVDDEVST